MYICQALVSIATLSAICTGLLTQLSSFIHCAIQWFIRQVEEVVIVVLKKNQHYKETSGLAYMLNDACTSNNKSDTVESHYNAIGYDEHSKIPSLGHKTQAISEGNQMGNLVQTSA